MNAVQQPAGMALERGAAAPRVEHRSRYFQGMSMLLLAIVLTGLSRTVFLRAFFQVPPIAPHIYVQTLVMTAWFTLLVVQTWRSKRRLHPATVWGVVGIFALQVLARVVVPATAAGQALVIALE